MSVIYTILIFGVIIFIHELGHFVVARLCKVTVQEFSMGMGPAIFKKQGKQTRYCVRLLPIGGFVAFEDEVEGVVDPNSFNSKPIWKRLLVLFAGAFMNLLLGFVIMLCIYAQQPVYNSPIVAKFLPNSTTQATGLQVKDEIIKMNKTTILNDRDIIFEIMRDDDGIVDLIVKRDGAKVSLPNVKFDTVGTGMDKTINIDFNVLGVERTALTAIDYTFRNTVSLARNSWTSIADLFTGSVKVSDLSGPVGVGQVVDQAKDIGFEAVFMLAALITISVGMFNILPFPALDGGRIVLLLLEAIRKKPINPKIEAAINGVGMVLLLGLMIFVTFKDIVKLF